MKNFVILVVLLAAATAFAADRPVRVETTPNDTVPTKTPSRELSPMMVEINAALESARLEVADLKRQYAAAGDDKTAMDLMQEVARVKRESRIEMMRIQLRYARQEGREEAANQLEEVVAKMTAPPVKGVPVPRADDHK